MTPELELARLVTDARLTPDALRVVLYVRGLGPAETEHDVKGEALAILLQGQEKPIRAAIARAEFCGYLRWRFGGRAGHKLTYVPPTENDASQGGKCQTDPEEMPPPEASINGNGSSGGVNSDPVGGGYMGGAAPSPAAAPEARAREAVENSARPAPNGARTGPPSDAELERLRAHLGEFAYAADVFAGSGPHSPTWCAAVMGIYGPHGTQRHFWANVPPEREPAILAEAMLKYASDFPGEAYRAPLFDSLLTTARDGRPKRASKPVPGTEHEQVRSNGHHSETPGGGRFLHRSGTGMAPISELLATLPARVQRNLRRSAEERAGERAPPEEVERILDELVTEYDRHHGAGATR